MRVYVAGKWGSDTIARVREVQDQLIGAGHTITYDWTTDQGDGSGTSSQAMNDMTGVLTADVFVLVAEAHDVVYCGAVAELGMALAIGLPVYVLGNALDTKRDVQGTCIFMKLPTLNRGEAALKADLLDGGLGDEHIRS